jgi:tetrahydromethanopterin S-methyltransferase subunit G
MNEELENTGEIEELETEGLAPEGEKTEKPEGEPETEGEKSEGEIEGETEGEGEAEVETVVQEINGVEWELPADVAKAVMQERDYTQSKQALAEEKRNFEATKAEYEERLVSDKEFTDLQIEHQSVQTELNKYESANWDELEAENPENANRHWRNYQLLQKREADLKEKVTEKHNERTQVAQQKIAKRIEQAKTYAEKNIPDWSPNLANKIEAYALSQGFDQASLLTNLSPALMKTLYDGYMGQEIKAKVAKPKAKGNVVPLKKVKAKSGTQTNRKDPDKMSFQEYEEARKSGTLK